MKSRLFIAHKGPFVLPRSMLISIPNCLATVTWLERFKFQERKKTFWAQHSKICFGDIKSLKGWNKKWWNSPLQRADHSLERHGLLMSLVPSHMSLKRWSVRSDSVCCGELGNTLEFLHSAAFSLTPLSWGEGGSIAVESGYVSARVIIWEKSNVYA